MRQIPVNEFNQPLGDAHPRTTISDATVRHMRVLYEEHNLGAPEIARRLGVAQGTVRKIIYYQRRISVPRDWRAAE